MRFRILVLLLITESEQRVSFVQGSKEEEDVLSCVNRIVKRHFDLGQHMVILTQGSKDYVKGMESTVRMIANVSNPDKMFSFSQTKQAVVFLNGNFHQDLNVLISFKSFHPRSCFVIVSTIIEGSGLSEKNYLTNVVNYLHRSQRWAVAIIARSIGGGVDLYGYTTTAYGNCGYPEIVKFGKCTNDGSISRLFPSYINYNQCPLRLSTLDWPPFAKFVIENGQKKSTGIESELANVIVQRLNATTFFIEAPPSKIRKIIANQSADIGYGQLAVYNGEEYSFTKCYSSVQGSVLFPRYSSTAHTDQQQFLPFKGDYKVLIGFILVVCFIVIFRSSLSTFKAISMLDTFALLLGLGVRAKPLSLSQRTYFMSLLFFGYIVTQVYLANLTMNLTTASDKSGITSMEELERSKIPIGGALSSLHFFQNKYTRLYKEFKVMDLTVYKKNLEMLYTGKGGLATYVEVSKYINYKHWENTAMIPEILTSYPVAMVVPNVSNILSTCDSTITAILEAGVIDHWAEVLKNQLSSQNMMTVKVDDNVSMDLRQFLIIFRCLAMALGFSIAVFIIELFVASCKAKKHRF